MAPSNITAPPLVSKPSSRLPPPSLFQGPPSRNTSAIDLGLPSAEPVLTHTTSRNSNELRPTTSAVRRPRGQSVAQSEYDRADAMWVEMQNTLAEVELSAENTNHLFSGKHAQALEELRTAQLALAQAWARSEGDDGVLDTTPVTEPKARDAAAKNSRDVRLPPDQKVAPAAAKPRNDSISGAIEEETEADIILARKRREANDKYFQRVNAGVLDVVAKLEEVALAMRQVEKESRDIWSETEDTSSTAETATDRMSVVEEVDRVH